jgi:Major Facilitator Superfamily
MKRTSIALASGLALADAAVVALALPPILLELDTSVEGVAAVIAVYTGVMAIALPLSAALHGPTTGAAGALLFAAASLGCASADSLELLLVMRALQALGGAALLAAAFDALDGGGAGRRLWVASAVAGTAAGPALGGALTEAFDWRAIFIVQAPIALAAAPALLASPIATVRESLPRPPADRPAALALALLSGALTAVLFFLVLLLVSGFSVAPLAAAAAVSVLPLAALAGSLMRGAPATRAVGGCLLVAGGIACLALLPEASALWTIVPQLLAGTGIGMAYPALAGELLPERSRGQAAALLSLRHAGITLALIALAPVVAAQLDGEVDLARERGTALVLDAPLPPTDKIEMAPRLFTDIDSEDPRDALAEAMDQERRELERGEELERLERELDDVLLAGADAAFSPAFALTGGLALLAALILLPRVRRRQGTMVLSARRGLQVGALALAALIALAVPLGYALGENARKAEPVQIADPCQERERRSVGGVVGTVEEVALAALDRVACKHGASREELVLALFDESSSRAYQREHGANPRSLEEIVTSAVGF